jgi:uncharacterized protein with NAD-binding domain and iron-sulfur cluster
VHGERESGWRSSVPVRPGLACAAQLNTAGHTVVVFERDKLPGGLLRYGIPDFKLEKSGGGPAPGPDGKRRHRF